MSPSDEMDSQSSSIYSPVPIEEQHDTLGRPTAKDSTKRVKIIALLVFGMALILALLFIFPREKLSTNGYNREKLPQKGPSIPAHVASHSGASPCGHDRAAAIENGCIFDMLAYAWVPHQCYDEELTNEFQALSDWEYYLDEKPATQSVSLSEVSKGEHHHLYVSWEWHLMHCVYIWKRIQRAAVPDGPTNGVDIVTATIEHTDHCKRIFMRENPPELKDINTRVRLKYLDCIMFR